MTATMSAADEIVGLAAVGRTIEAADRAEQVLDLRGEAGDPMLLDAWAAASLAAGRHCVDVRHEVGGAYYEHAASGDGVGAGIAATVRGRLELAAGRAGSAARWLQRAVRVLDGAEGADVSARARALRTAHAVRTQAEALLGHDVSPTLDRVASTDGIPAPRAGERIDLLLARAWGMAAIGEPVRGSEILLGAARDCGERITDEAAVLHAALRLGAPPARVAGRLAELADSVEGPMVALFSQRAAGLVADDGQLLDVAASAFEALGLDLLAAEVWGEAAAAYRRQGRRTSSAALTLSSARMALARCEGATTPVVQATVEDGSQRTGRQAVTSGTRSTRSRCATR